MEILVKQGRWLVNGKSTEELTQKEFDSLNNHLALIREDYYLHHNKKYYVHKKDISENPLIIFLCLLGIFSIVYGFVKFVANHNQKHQITNQWK